MPRSHLGKDESGIALTEYLLLLGLLTAATVFGVLSFGDALGGAWGRVSSLYAAISVNVAGGDQGNDDSEVFLNEPEDEGSTPPEEPPPTDQGKGGGKDLPCDNGIANSGGAAGGSNCGGKK